VELSLLVSVAALLVSIWAIIASNRTARSQTLLQEQLLKLEHARERDRVTEATTASLVAQMYLVDRSARLQIANTGQANALDVRVQVDGTPIQSHQLFRRASERIPVIGPDARVEILMMTFDGMPDSYLVELEWQNAAGRPGKWRSQVTLVR
jgi:hypothetical protein